MIYQIGLNLKLWALATVVVGSIILASEIAFWILFLCGNEYARAIWNVEGIENQVGLVVETPAAIFVGIAMIVGGALNLRSERKN